MGKMRIAYAAMMAMLGIGKSEAQKNALTDAERAAGYQLLFNGSDMSGWRSWNNTTPPSSWAAVAESTWKVLYIQSGSPQSSLITADQSFRNFDFMIEWSIGSAGNSGIFIRYNKFNVDSWGGASGPEAQIAATNNSDGQNAKHRAGTCYDLFPLQSRALSWDGNPNYNRYQQFRIVAYEGHVAHFGNGVKLLEYVIRSPEWNTAYNASKYATYPDYATVHPGAIYLQHHGENGAAGPKFRNIRIKKLTENPWAKGSPYLANPNDTTALKDLAFTDLIGTTVSLLPSRPGSGAGYLSVLPSGGGYRIRFPAAGDYRLATQDMLGRSRPLLTLRNADEAWLPAEAARGGTVLSVWSGDTRIHSGPLPAR